MDPITILKTSSEAISLVAALAKLIKENRDKKSATPTSLSEVLARLQIDAVVISGDLENKLRLLRGKLQELGIDPDKTIESQLKDLTWFNWRTRSRLKALREECNAAYRQLTSFIDDATALLLCEGDGSIRSAMFAEAYAVKRALDVCFLDRGRSIGSILDELLETAARINADLRAA